MFCKAHFSNLHYILFLQDHEYILHPITAQGKVTRNTSALPLRSASTPRISLELTLSDMSVMLATDQYQSLNLWQREFSRHGRRRKFRQGRPACSVMSRFVLKNENYQLKK